MIGFIGAILSLFAALPMCVSATHYGTSYNGQQMSCEGSYLYDSSNPAIIARGWDSPYQCGDKIRVVGPHGSIIGYVEDRCTGCGTGVDLSEAGHEIVCGNANAGRCPVFTERIP